jgi:hypothetical protein
MDTIVLLATDGTVTDTLMTFPSDQVYGPGARAENRFRRCHRILKCRIAPRIRVTELRDTALPPLYRL